MKTLLLATALLTIVAAGACSDGPSMSNNPMGPSAVAEGAGSSGTGAMPGMGMAVASEFDYLTRMIPHHDEAIATARILQQGTERQEMRGFAASIIDTQSAEVQLMKEWLAVWVSRPRHARQLPADDARPHRSQRERARQGVPRGHDPAPHDGGHDVAATARIQPAPP